MPISKPDDAFKYCNLNAAISHLQPQVFASCCTNNGFVKEQHAHTIIHPDLLVVLQELVWMEASFFFLSFQQVFFSVLITLIHLTAFELPFFFVSFQRHRNTEAYTLTFSFFFSICLSLFHNVFFWVVLLLSFTDGQTENQRGWIGYSAPVYSLSEGECFMNTGLDGIHLFHLTMIVVRALGYIFRLLLLLVTFSSIWFYQICSHWVVYWDFMLLTNKK